MCAAVREQERQHKAVKLRQGIFHGLFLFRANEEHNESAATGSAFCLQPTIIIATAAKIIDIFFMGIVV